MSINMESLPHAGYYISTDKALLNQKAIFKFLKEESYWSQKLTTEKLRIAIDNSLCFGVYRENETVGFARVITDYSNFAYLCDVFIIPEHRKQGLSKWMLQTILEHPALQGMRRFMLATADAHELYRQFGFTELSKPERWMEIYRP
ncbi:GNAT family N-acetyltransferase [Mucilaginibacter koreensis]